VILYIQNIQIHGSVLLTRQTNSVTGSTFQSAVYLSLSGHNTISKISIKGLGIQEYHWRLWNIFSELQHTTVLSQYFTQNASHVFLPLNKIELTKVIFNIFILLQDAFIFVKLQGKICQLPLDYIIQCNCM